MQCNRLKVLQMIPQLCFYVSGFTLHRLGCVTLLEHVTFIYVTKNINSRHFQFSLKKDFSSKPQNKISFVVIKQEK